ncbi:MAG TPA: phage major capsid protein [Gemmataceae bacterium]|nr:phage major capsid protein [Gemmataceae bacterium]
MFVQLAKEFMGKKAGERIDVAEADAQHLIGQGLAVPVADDVITPAVSKALESAFGKFTQSLDTVIAEGLKTFQNAQGQARRHAVPAIFGAGGEGDVRHNFGDFCLSIAVGNRKRLEEEYGSYLVDDKGVRTKAALAESSGVTGGYVVPPDFYDRLLAIIAENNFIRPRAFVQPMASATLQFPYLDTTTVQAAGVSPFFGGVQVYWTEEAQTRTETEPQFKMMELKAHELSGYSVSSNVLLQDAAFGLEKFLFTLFGQAIAWFEEYAFLQGNGVGKPVGMLNCPAVIKVNRNTGGAVKFADVAAMYSKLLPASMNRAIWVHSPTVIPQLLQLQDGANRSIFISIDQGATRRPNWALLGLPTFCTEKLPALGTLGDLLLVDPQLYVIGDRMQIEIAVSEHVNFLKNQMTWRIVERIDGQPWLEKPITLQDGSTQVSPFVALN